MPDNHSEEAAKLAFRLLAGEEQAYLDFQWQYRRLFLAVLLSLEIPPFEAEDLTESTITDILLKLHKWDPQGGNFDAWVITIVRNVGLEWLREQAKAPRVALTPDFDPQAKALDVLDPERAAAVHEAMTKLSPSDRAIIELREFGQYQPYTEIAAMLTRISGKTVTEGAARVRHKRALERLADLLRDDPRIKFRHLKSMQGGPHERSEERQGS